MDEGVDESYYQSRFHKLVLFILQQRPVYSPLILDPVVSSSNIPTIPLTVAQAMNPSPRPPSPTARAATQRAHRRENPNQLSSRDAQVLLMAMPQKSPSINGTQDGERARVESFFTNGGVSGDTPEPATPKTHAASPKVPAPPRPSRETRRRLTSPPPDVSTSLRKRIVLA